MTREPAGEEKATAAQPAGMTAASREALLDNVIVYMDEAACAVAMLTPLLASGASRTPTHWIVVGCAPRITHNASRWVTHSARQSWRGKWADKLFAQVVPLLQGPVDCVTTRIASGPLGELTDSLLAQYGPARVLDARRPKPGPGPQSGTSQPDPAGA